MPSPSERIRLIREIASRLSGEEWAIIDLTLRQFGLPTDAIWEGNPISYVIAMIEGADPEALAGLAEHVGIDLKRSSSLAPTFWDQGAFRLFVSHISADKALASDLQIKLKLLGISAFIAHRDIEPTKEWQNEIELALSTCDALLALLQPKFHASFWTDQEIGFAMGRGALVVSVKYDQDPYGFIGKYQALVGTKRSSDDLVEELFKIFLSNKLTSDRMLEALVHLFDSSNTFADAKRHMSLLERCPFIPKRLLSHIQFALETNDQINQSYGVPERVKALVARHSSR